MNQKTEAENSGYGCYIAYEIRKDAVGRLMQKISKSWMLFLKLKFEQDEKKYNKINILLIEDEEFDVKSKKYL